VRRRRRVVVVLALATLPVSGGSLAFAQEVPPTLSGEFFHQDVPTITSIDCREGLHFTYLATGTATGPYPGTFTETGAVDVEVSGSTVTSSRFSARFTIDSPVGRVTGTTSGGPGVSCGSGDFCEGAADCEGEGVAFNSGGTYEATITTADGSFADHGILHNLQLFRGDHPSPLDGFDEDFLSDLRAPIPLAPTTKDQCKRGGWRQFDFKNQGQCVAFVQRGPKP
jgi:hypothetical protein